MDEHKLWLMNYAKQNGIKIRPVHIRIYCYLSSKCDSLNYTPESSETIMNNCKIGSRRIYYSSIKELCEIGLISIKKGKNKNEFASFDLLKKADLQFLQSGTVGGTVGGIVENAMKRNNTNRFGDLQFLQSGTVGGTVGGIVESSKKIHSDVLKNILNELDNNYELINNNLTEFIRHIRNFTISSKIKKADTNTLIIKTPKERKNELWETMKLENAKKVEKMEQEDLVEFGKYWCEMNPNGKKMRFEMEKVFDVSRRMDTWIKNKKNRKINNNQEPTKIGERKDYKEWNEE